MKYGKLTVLNFHHFSRTGQKYFNCECECGRHHVARLDCIIGGHIKSCGCVGKGKVRENNYQKARKYVLGESVLSVPEWAQKWGVRKETLWKQIRRMGWVEILWAKYEKKASS